MSLTIEWQHRAERWQKALWALCYRPLASIPFTGFTTKEQLTCDQAMNGPFQPMPTGTAWGGKWEYAWFKGSLTLPAESAGKRIVMRLDTGGESLVWINGRVMGSIGWAHKEITLTTNAQPGETYELLIESYAGHGHITTGDGPYPDGVESVPEPGLTQKVVGQSTFGVWREEVYQAAIDFTTLFQLRGQIDPLSLRASQIDECLMDTTLLIDPELPEAELLETIRAGRERMQPLLASKNGPTMPTMYAFGHAHIDVAWLWPLKETERKIARTVINQLALFDEYPEFKFLQSQPHLYWMLQQDYPELYERFCAAVKSGNVIPDGAMWVEADTNISGGEALIRQVMYGRQFFQEELGIDSRVLWLPDVFGYSGALPQILKGCGVTGFTTQKITWAYNGGDPFPYNTFCWEGIDGTAIPAHIFTDYNSETRPSNIAERWNTRLQQNNINAMIFAFGWGDGGGGPTRDHLEFLRRAQDLEGLPRMKMATPREFFEDQIAQGMVKERYVGELYFQAHRGTYTSQARTKRGNRKSEFAMREAEMWGTLARSLKGFEFTPKTLTTAWRKVLLNQFHDILPGSSIHRVYEDAERLHAEAIAEAQQVAQAAAAALTTPSNGCTVFNSLSWARTALVDTGGGPVEVEVPAVGWATLPAGPQPVTAGTEVTIIRDGEGCYVLENALIRVTINPRGEVVSLWDKETQRETMAGAGNRLCLYKDVPDHWDAWDLDSMAEMQPVKTDEPVTLAVAADGPVVARLTLHRKLNKSIVDQVISLRRSSRRVDFTTTIDWQESHKLLKVAFPVAMHTSEAIHEIQFGHLRRPNHKSRPFDADRFEVSAHKWSALAEENRGAAVLNDCKYGLSVTGNSINLTLLKSALAPDMTADKGMQNVTYALYAWNGGLAESGVVREAYDLNVPVMVVPGAANAISNAASLFSLDAENVIIDTIKPAEDGSRDVIVRLYESKRTATCCALTTALPVVSAVETNLVEEETGRLEISGSTISLDFRPFEIKTVRLHL